MRNLHCTSAWWSRRSGVAHLLCATSFLAFALAALPARAGVSETLDYTDYAVQGDHRGSLGLVLDENSPIRHDGQTYHAYTSWLVVWHYTWRADGNGSCRIVQTDTDLHSTITLPRLDGGSPLMRERFERYLTALREHELGHHQIGLQAAQEVDRQLQGMPPMADCQRLETAANKLAARTVNRFKDEERTYDLITVHGRLQGARLDYDY